MSEKDVRQSMERMEAPRKRTYLSHELERGHLVPPG